MDLSASSNKTSVWTRPGKSGASPLIWVLGGP